MNGQTVSMTANYKPSRDDEEPADRPGTPLGPMTELVEPARNPAAARLAVVRQERDRALSAKKATFRMAAQAFGINRDDAYLLAEDPDACTALACANAHVTTEKTGWTISGSDSYGSYESWVGGSYLRGGAVSHQEVAKIVAAEMRELRAGPGFADSSNARLRVTARDMSFVGGSNAVTVTLTGITESEAYSDGTQRSKYVRLLDEAKRIGRSYAHETEALTGVANSSSERISSSCVGSEQRKSGRRPPASRRHSLKQASPTWGNGRPLPGQDPQTFRNGGGGNRRWAGGFRPGSSIRAESL